VFFNPPQWDSLRFLFETKVPKAQISIHNEKRANQVPWLARGWLVMIHKIVVDHNDPTD
jgi:hypothetical protein